MITFLRDFGTQAPVVFLTFIPVILLLCGVFVSYHARHKHCKELGVDAQKTPPTYFWILVCLLSLIIVALTRPYSGYTDLPIKQQSSNLMFVVDISASMLADDLKPSRIEGAKRKIIDALNYTKQSGLTMRFGITVFAGDGYAICPLTTDAAVVRQFTQILSPELVTSRGSNIQAGIEASLNRIPAKSQSTSIVLLTDGEPGNAKTESVRFSDSIPIHVIGFGTPTGSTIRLPDGSYQRNKTGKVVISKLDETYLTTLAERNNGTYTRATFDDKDITRILNRLQTKSVVSQEITEKLRVFNELGPIILAFGLALLFLRRLAGIFLSSVFWVLAAQFLSNRAHAESINFFKPDLAKERYEGGDFSQAEKLYRDRLAADPQDRIAKRGLASALFKLGKYSESKELFHALADDQYTGKDYFENSFNEGNSLLALKNYTEAIDAYNRALEVKSDDKQVIHNRRIARKLRDSPKPQPSPASTDNSSAANKPGEQNNDQLDKGTPNTDSSQREPTQTTPTDPTPNTAGQSNEVNDLNQTSNGQKSEPAAQNDRKKEAASQRSSTPSPPEATQPTQQINNKDYQKDMSPSLTPTVPPTSLESPETKAWLESLPDSPLLIRRQTSSNSKSDQQW
jgi:Ca-activated chloride channel family protein